jgi:hypothetical protein
LIPRVNKNYLLKRGSEFKTIFMDATTAELWVKAGWELGKDVYESQYEALLAMHRLSVTLEVDVSVMRCF